MRNIKYILGVLMFVLVILAVAFAGFRLAFRGLIFPRVTVAGVDVTGMDRASALQLVSSYFKNQPSKVILTSGGKEVLNLKGLSVEHQFDWAIDQATKVGRNGNILTQIKEQITTLTEGRNIEVPLNFDRDELKDLIGQVAEDIDQEPIWPKLAKTSGEIKLVKGKNGVSVKTEPLIEEIVKNLSLPGMHVIEVPSTTVETTENEKLVNSAKQALEKWGELRLKLRFRDFEKTLKADEMVGLFGLTTEEINSESFDQLLEEIKPLVEVDSRDAVFVFEEGKVKEFKPEVVGAVIDIPNLKTKLAEQLLSADDRPLEIPAILSYPKIRTGDINDLGIKELLGSGKSTFYHSIPGRVFNVNLAATRVNGTLVAPGEEFSFNKAVGDISRATGYQQAYIISAGRTVLGDGGGVCQVSTTTFRAAMDAGLPITERKAHAYRVGYYEQDSAPGIDATVFSPTADLKFLNDTGHYILIQQTVDTKNLTMKVDIYGTSDGRKSTITKPRISSQTAPPPTLYVDDPTLPAGTVKQVDWSAWGAKVAFDYKVEKNGVVTYEKTFVSNYQPWRAIYMRGTAGIASR